VLRAVPRVSGAEPDHRLRGGEGFRRAPDDSGPFREVLVSFFEAE